MEAVGDAELGTELGLLGTVGDAEGKGLVGTRVKLDLSVAVGLDVGRNAGFWLGYELGTAVGTGVCEKLNLSVAAGLDVGRNAGF